MAEPTRTSFFVRHWATLAVVLGLVVLANGALDLLVIRPMVRVSGDREAILTGRRAEIREAQDKVTALERTASKIACTRGDVRVVFEETLSSKVERMTAILRELRRLATDHRMDPESLQIQKQPLRESGLVRFGVSFPLEGSYATLREFILQVESSPNFLMIDDIRLDDQKTQGKNLRMDVRVATFFRDPDLARLEAVFAARGRRR